MAHDKKKQTKRKNKTVKRAEVAKKKTPNKKVSFLKLVPRSKRSVLKSALALLLLILIAGAIPLPYKFTKSATLSYADASQDSAEFELGDSKVIQEGHDGTKRIEVKSLQSIWGRLFNLNPIQQKEIASVISEEPINRITVNGTRKFQYMICSDGSYRYYTDEEFKSAYTGFTSKSNDFCKENNQGEKIKLADTPDGIVINQTAPKVVNNPKGCEEITVPHGTEYMEVARLPKGTQEVAVQGVDGLKIRCPGEEEFGSDGSNELILVGTGKTDAETQAEKDADEVRRQQELVNQQNQRLTNYRNCVSQLAAQGIQNTTKCEYLL